MTVPVWPTDLPKPLRAGYSQERQDTRLRKASGGPPGYRRRFSSAARLVTLSIEVTRARKAIFDNFYVVETVHGSKPFQMPDPTTDGVALLSGDYLPILTSEGEPILLSAQWLCLFGEQVPSERLIGGRFEISFSVAVLP